MSITKTKGKHPSKALNPVKIKALGEPGRYADGNGLYLVVDPSGAKRWVLRTVIRGRRTDIGLGGLATVSLAEARIVATKLRQAARQGDDPLAKRKTSRRVMPTFGEASYKVHGARVATWKNMKHRNQWLSSLEAHVFPTFGTRPIDRIQSSDVLVPFTRLSKTASSNAAFLPSTRIAFGTRWCD